MNASTTVTSAALSQFRSRVVQVADELGHWLEQCDYAGNDPYQLDHMISRVGGRPLIGPVMGFARKVLKPYHAFIPKRLFQASTPILMAQALGDALSGEGHAPPGDLPRRRAARLFALIKQTRSPLARNAGWGLPFFWGGSDKHPPHWPTAITTTIVLEALLDARHLLASTEVLGLVESGIRFLLEECGVVELPEGDCILYGPGDTRLILNQSAAAAGLIARAGALLGRDDLVAQAGRAALLVAHHQNKNGSWYFAPAHAGHPVDTIIDSRHTGYIIEGLSSVEAVLPQTEVAAAIERGWAYNVEHLVDAGKPRWSPAATWPIDAHDVAQSILTALAHGDQDLAAAHVGFALDRFYIGGGVFRYKAFENGNGNDAVFIRWTQAPMYKALRRYAAESQA